MKIVFAGPTLRGIALDAFPSIEFRPPARCGEIVRALRDGAATIGIIDGVFEFMPSVWHKEILLALSEGIPVLGAASMGALRAAECHAFGMIGIGEVFQAYANGLTEDDEDVAQLHGPEDVGYLPLSEPMVNIRATLQHLLAMDLLSEPEHQELRDCAQALFFKERTYRRIVSNTTFPDRRKLDLLTLLKNESINVKQNDAKLLLYTIESSRSLNILDFHQVKWHLARTRSLQMLLGDM